MQKVAFIGLGAMGEPMAGNLLKKGFSVNILGTRSPEPIARLKELGATVTGSPAEAAKDCEVAILALPSSDQVEEVIAGKDGLAESMAAGSVIVDCTTSDPTSTRRLGDILRARKIGFVDAGLTRGVAGAKNAKLAYFVGGDSGDIEKAKPALEAMGDTFFVIGGLGSGHEAKIISNMLSYATVAVVNEALMLGRSLGLDLDKLFEALMAGAMSKALESFGPTIISGNFDTPRVAIKNVGIHLDVAQKIAGLTATPMFVTAAAQEVYQLAAANGHGEKDMGIISQIWTKAESKK